MVVTVVVVTVDGGVPMLVVVVVVVTMPGRVVGRGVVLTVTAGVAGLVAPAVDAMVEVAGLVVAAAPEVGCDDVGLVAGLGLVVVDGLAISGLLLNGCLILTRPAWTRGFVVRFAAARGRVTRALPAVVFMRAVVTREPDGLLRGARATCAGARRGAEACDTRGCDLEFMD